MLLQLDRPGQAGLLVHGGEDLEGAVHHPRVGDRGKAGGYADAVVGPEGRATCAYEVAFHEDVDRVLGEVELHVLVLLADHVHVALEHDGRGGLAARAGLHPDDDVAGGIHPVLASALLAPRDEPVPELVLVAGLARDARDLVEPLPELGRLDAAQRIRHVLGPP